MKERQASLPPEDLYFQDLHFDQYAQRETRSKTKTKEPNQRTPDPLSAKINKTSTVQPTKEKTKPSDGAKSIPTDPNQDVTPDKAVSGQSPKHVKVTQAVKEDNRAKISSTAYRSRAPVETGLDIEKLVETVLDLEINIPLRSLAGVSSAIQKEIRKQVTKTRQIIEEAAPARQYIRLGEIPSIGIYSQNAPVITEEGCVVAEDPVLQYLAEHADASSSDLIVGSISEPLKAIYTMINQVGQEESLLDSGSMIVSMAKEVAVQLGLTWDPTIQINMESASNHLEKTLGLARNVNFNVGGLNFLLQVHILEAPPYRVLLGRPFDRHASSIVQTKLDGATELVLTDPNSKRIAIIPTYERGVGPEELQKQKYQSF